MTWLRISLTESSVRNVASSSGNPAVTPVSATTVEVTTMKDSDENLYVKALKRKLRDLEDELFEKNVTIECLTIELSAARRARDIAFQQWKQTRRK